VTAANGHRRETQRAPERGSVCDIVVRHIEQTCRRVVDGRHAARALAEWAKRFELSEAEFQLLWCLRSAVENGLDQTTLAGKLASSPAQVSATVERARAKGWICQQSARGDRRRHRWQLASDGRNLLEKMLAEAAFLRSEPVTGNELGAESDPPGEVAA
jgi:DNA-binding MarR family transcriptional regulator